MGVIRYTRGTLLVGAVLLKNGVLIFDSAVRPVDGVNGTMAGKAGPGSLCIRTTGKLYTNVGTKASPIWAGVAIGAASVSPSASKSPSASVSLSKSPSASKSPSVSVSPS